VERSYRVREQVAHELREIIRTSPDPVPAVLKHATQLDPTRI
jgi:hypothetical protein